MVNDDPIMSISQMENEDYGYSVLWAIQYNSDNDFFLYPNFPLYRRKKGTVGLFISRKYNVWCVEYVPYTFAKKSSLSSNEILKKGFIPCVILNKG